MVPLFDLEEGDVGEIVEISDTKSPNGKGFWKKCRCEDRARFSDLGLRVGKTIKMLRNHRRGPLMIKIDDARFAIGRRMAEKIKIENTANRN